MVGNLVLRWCAGGDIKRDSWTYIRQYTSQNENFEYSYPRSDALVTVFLKKDSENVVCCAYVQRLPAAYTAWWLHKTTCQPMKKQCYYTYWRLVCDSISQDILSQIIKLSSQTWRYICKCIRMGFIVLLSLLVDNCRFWVNFGKT